MIRNSWTKRCTACGQTKPRAEFNASTARPDGLQPCCKLCQRSVRREDYMGFLCDVSGRSSGANIGPTDQSFVAPLLWVFQQMKAVAL